ncbi:MAG: hypothetical protein JWO67_2906 [Streptosporangiaceae bacterium]|nr:hypothetical protein [Streptosporangiaceae bacterium]
MSADECELCGVADGTLLLLIGPANGFIDAHVECGAARGYVPTPACEGADDPCGAPPGHRCEPGCPSRADDPDGIGS